MINVLTFIALCVLLECQLYFPFAESIIFDNFGNMVASYLSSPACVDVEVASCATVSRAGTLTSTSFLIPDL